MDAHSRRRDKGSFVLLTFRTGYTIGGSTTIVGRHSRGRHLFLICSTGFSFSTVNSTCGGLTLLTLQGGVGPCVVFTFVTISGKGQLDCVFKVVITRCGRGRFFFTTIGTRVSFYCVLFGARNSRFFYQFGRLMVFFFISFGGVNGGGCSFFVTFAGILNGGRQLFVGLKGGVRL